MMQSLQNIEIFSERERERDWEIERSRDREIERLRNWEIQWLKLEKSGLEVSILDLFWKKVLGDLTSQNIFFAFFNWIRKKIEKKLKKKLKKKKFGRPGHGANTKVVDIGLVDQNMQYEQNR